MRHDWRISPRCILLLCWLCIGAAAYGQQLPARRADRVTKTTSWSDVLARGEVRVGLGGFEPAAVNVERLNITILSLPSSTRLDPGIISRVHLVAEPEAQLVIEVGSRQPPAALDDQLLVSVQLPPAAAQQDDMAAYDQMVDAMPRMLAEGLAYTKTSQERRVMLAPSFSVPAGGGGEVAVNGVLYARNPLKMGSLVNHVEFNLNMDRGSDEKADPNFLTFGVSFRKLIPLHRGRANKALLTFRTASNRLRAVRGRSTSGVDTLQERAQMDGLFAQAMDEAQALNETFFREAIITWLHPRPEMNFSGLRPGPVINFVNTSDVQVRTGSRPFFTPNISWSLKLTPFNLETGVTMRNIDNKARQGRPIVRLGAGGAAMFRFRFPCRDDLIADRVELEVKGLARHLFNRESAYDQITRRNDNLVSGYKYFTQVELTYVTGLNVPFPSSILGMKLPAMRRKLAVEVSYKNGFAPPAYAYTNSVGWRFKLVSSDEDNANDLGITSKNLGLP